MRRFGVFLVAFLVAFSVQIYAQNSAIEHVIKQAKWHSFECDMDMYVAHKGGSKKLKKIKVYVRQTQESQDLMMRFVAPSNMRGTAFLAFNRKNGDDEWYIYIRPIRRVKRIPPSATNFMQRNFLSLYLLKPRTELWQFSSGEEVMLNGKKVIKVVGKARDSRTVRATGYSQIVHYIEPERWVILKTEFYDDEGKLARTQQVSRFEQINGVWIPVEYSTDDMAENVTADVKIYNIKLDKKIPEDYFTVRYLKSL